MYVWNNEPENIFTGDGNELTSFLESSEFDLDTGKQLMFIDKLIPDYTFDAGQQVNFLVTIRDYPNGTKKEKGPFLICLLYTSPSPRDGLLSRMPSSA